MALVTMYRNGATATVDTADKVSYNLFYAGGWREGADGGVFDTTPKTGEAFRKLIPATSRNLMAMNGLSSGTSQGTNYRTMYRTMRRSRVSGFRLVYSNTQLTASGEVDGTHPYSVKASIEYNGAVYPVWFAGSRTITLAPGAHVVSDVVGVSIPADTVFFVRSYPTTATLGDKWPVSGTLITGEGESYLAAADKTDDLTSIGANAASGFGPVAILGHVGFDVPTVGIIGSSSAFGQGDAVSGPRYNYGYLSRFAGDILGTGYVKMTRASDTMAQMLADYRRRLSYLSITNPSHVIQQMGSNDISNGGSFDTVKARLIETWAILDSMGHKVIQTTYTPTTTSTDNWATVANQTVAASNPVRIAINDWIRTCPGPLTGYLECSDQVETARNSGIWKVDGTANKYTVDGLHLSPFAHLEVANSLDATLFQ